MAISKYVDKKDGKEYYCVRLCLKSTMNNLIRVDKKQSRILTIQEAEKIEKKFKQEGHRTLFEKENQALSWGHILEEWELAARNENIFLRQITDQTREEYYILLKRWTEDWHKIPVDQLDRATVWRKLDQIEKEVSISRSKRFKTAFENVLNWANLSGLAKIPTLPSTGYKTLNKVEERIPEILNIEEIRTLLKQAITIKHEWYEIWALALYTGMRSGELYALQWDAIDFDAKLLYVHRNWKDKVCGRPKDHCSCSTPAGRASIKGCIGPTKGRYWRTVPIADDLLDLLKELKAKRGDKVSVLERFQDWTDGSQAQVLRTFCVGIGITSVMFHTLRACFATQLIKDGVPPATVMKICGWKDLKTMMRYIRLAGIEVKGATDVLKLMPEREVMGNVIKLFRQ